MIVSLVGGRTTLRSGGRFGGLERREGTLWKRWMEDSPSGLPSMVHECDVQR